MKNIFKALFEELSQHVHLKYEYLYIRKKVFVIFPFFVKICTTIIFMKQGRKINFYSSPHDYSVHVPISNTQAFWNLSTMNSRCQLLMILLFVILRTRTPE